VLHVSEHAISSPRVLQVQRQCFDLSQAGPTMTGFVFDRCLMKSSPTSKVDCVNRLDSDEYTEQTTNIAAAYLDDIWRSKSKPLTEGDIAVNISLENLKILDSFYLTCRQSNEH
jgi:hypothetical protein